MHSLVLLELKCLLEKSRHFGKKIDFEKIHSLFLLKN